MHRCTDGYGRGSQDSPLAERNPRIAVAKGRGCRACTEVIEAFIGAKIPFWTIDLTVEPWRRDEIHELSGLFSVPQIFLDGKYIGSRDYMKSETNGFEPNQLQIWYSNAMKEPVQNGGIELKATPDLCPASLKNNTLRWAGPKEIDACTYEAVLEECAWKAFSVRQVVGFESKELSLENLRQLVLEEKWAFEEKEIDGEILRLGRAGALNFPGLTRQNLAEEVDLPDFVRFEKVQSVNNLLDFSCLSRSARPADVVVARLRIASTDLYEKLLFADGKGVAYENVGKYPTLWKTFLGLLAELQGIQGIEETPVNFRTSFFINLYNILHFASCVMFGDPQSSADRVKFFSLSVQLGEYTVTMDDIEHGILRGVRFPQKDHRSRLVVPFDPRIHFALNCGAKSCPSISTYSADSLHEELKWATASYCSASLSISDDDTVTVSRLFNWYRNDFTPQFDGQGKRTGKGTSFAIISWILEHGGLNPATEMYARLSTIVMKESRSKTSQVKLQWARYEWLRATLDDDLETSETESSGQKRTSGNGLSASMMKSDLFFLMRRRRERKMAATRVLAVIT